MRAALGGRGMEEALGQSSGAGKVLVVDFHSCTNMRQVDSLGLRYWGGTDSQLCCLNLFKKNFHNARNVL
jgi:hypothetical protein